MSNFRLAKGHIQKDYNGKSPYHVDMAFPGDYVSAVIKI